MQIVDQEGWRKIKDANVIRELCMEALTMIDTKQIIRKYRLGQHKKSGNKRAVTVVVAKVLEISNDKAHTRIAQTIVQDILDDMVSNKI